MSSPPDTDLPCFPILPPVLPAWAAAGLLVPAARARTHGMARDKTAFCLHTVRLHC